MSETKLDHLNGRTVVSIDNADDADKHWAIRLEGDTLIRNEDSRADAPGEIAGLVLLASETRQRKTMLSFGHSGMAGSETQSQVTLATDGYSIITPESTGEDEILLEDALPPDPSPDRVADGPEEQDAGT